MKEKCAIKRCRGLEYLIYYGFPLCWKCWFKYCENELDLKKELHIGEKENEIKIL